MAPEARAARARALASVGERTETAEVVNTATLRPRRRLMIKARAISVRSLAPRFDEAPGGLSHGAIHRGADVDSRVRQRRALAAASLPTSTTEWLAELERAIAEREQAPPVFNLEVFGNDFDRPLD